MKTTKGKTIIGEDVVLDDAEFIDCKFKSCRFTYAGGIFNIERCDFQGQCTFAFTGAAQNTGRLLQKLGWRPPSGKPSRIM